MVDLIKEQRDIRIQYPVQLLALERDRQRIQRIVLATSRPKPIREHAKTGRYISDRQLLVGHLIDCLDFAFLVTMRGDHGAS